MFGAPVPETPINKNSELDLPKNKIRFAKYQMVTSPARNAIQPKQSDQCEFGGFVAPSTDQRHHLGTLGFGENVRHLCEPGPQR